MTKLILYFSLATIGIMLGCMGCVPSGRYSPASGPFLTVETNVVTNVFNVTNLVAEVATATNLTPAGPVVFSRTNYVPVIVTVTNTVEERIHHISDGAKGAAGIIGTVGNAIHPVAGTILEALIIGSLSIFAAVKNRQRKKEKQSAENWKTTAAILSQTVETGREVMKVLPNGRELEKKWLDWMARNQGKAGVMQNVLQLLSGYTSNGDAKAVAEELTRLMNSPEGVVR